MFNLLFNLNYHWYGVSLIVRSYLFIFSFYLIFNYASIKANRFIEVYRGKYGKKGEWLLFLEIRIVPFIIIYLTTVIFTFIDYARYPDWPLNPVFSLLNGRFSNIIIYSLILLLILKIKKSPNITIPLFLIISVAFFFIDKMVYTLFTGGYPIILFKLIKISFFIFFLCYEFFGSRWKIVRLAVYSLFTGFISLLLVFSIIISGFLFSGNSSYHKRETGLILLKSGFSFPLPELMTSTIKMSDTKLFVKILFYAKRYNFRLVYNSSEWEYLLSSSSITAADQIAEYMLDRNVKLRYDIIVSLAERWSLDNKDDLQNAPHIVTLATFAIRGNETDFIKRIRRSNIRFKLWAITVLAEGKSMESVPFLLMYLVSLDRQLSQEAYLALKRITGIDPKRELGKRINDPDVLSAFKKYYLINKNN